jgi:hypothetical protein
VTLPSWASLRRLKRFERATRPERPCEALVANGTQPSARNADSFGEYTRSLRHDRQSKRAPSYTRRVKEAFALFLRPMEAINKNPRRAMESPRTTLDRIRRNTERLCVEQFKDGTPEAFFRLLLEAVPRDADAILLVS